MKEEKNPSITQWREDERPRERLLALGPSALTNAELLAILIHTGSETSNAVELMAKVLHACGNSLDTLGEISYEKLTSFKGIGQAKAVSIMAACELGRRRMKKDNTGKISLENSGMIYERVLKPLFWDLTEEECHVVLLTTSLTLISTELVGKGGLTAVNTDIRKILRMALEKNATALVLAHNHPSGRLVPSKEDDRLTQSLLKACDIMDIKMLDHLIVHGEDYYSYAEDGRL
ncbi:MAG: DNA repair protein RadC [Bacteroidaceae bacterium]|nr:DNA repair protein RadC [Bacteroidaceae bacterium]